MEDGVLSLRHFRDIDLNDVFFDTLKADYPGFEAWFEKKAGERAFVCFADNGSLQGFLYTKQESDALSDIQPVLPAAERLKVGTFKVNAHGTKLGERFMKKIFDIAVACSASEVYVTVFPKHAGLVAEQADGTRRIYRLNPAGVGALRDQLDAFWDRALAGYTDAVEQLSKEDP